MMRILIPSRNIYTVTYVNWESTYTAIAEIEGFPDCVSTTNNYHANLTSSLAISDLGTDKGVGTLRPS